MELTLAQRKAITQAQLAKWPKATRAEKGVILDAVCEVTGWHRDHARKAIRTALAGKQPHGPRQPREPIRRYDDAAVALLTRCWAVLDGPTGKRLRPALPELIANLSAHGHLAGIDPAVVDQVLAMSAATIDRRLAAARAGLVARKTISHTRPGSMLKSSIPMKTWQEWNDTLPGFLPTDLVGHEGGDNNGAFFYTLDATDIATGWTEAVTVRSKGERIVAAGLEELWLRFPFHIAGIHSDNGSEFINHQLARWCTTRLITFTRGRSSHKTTKPMSSRRTGRSCAATSATSATTPATSSTCSTSCGRWACYRSTCSSLNRSCSPRPAPAPPSARPTTSPPPRCND